MDLIQSKNKNKSVIIAAIAVFIISEFIFIISESSSHAYNWGKVAICQALSILFPLFIVLSNKIPHKLKLIMTYIYPLIIALTVEYLTLPIKFVEQPLDSIIKVERYSSISVIFITITIYYCLFFLILLISRRAWLANIICLFPALLSIINYYIVLFRGTSLFPWDLTSAGTAANVIGNYRIIISRDIAIVLILIIGISIMGFYLSINLRREFSPRVRIISTILIASLLLGGVIYINKNNADDQRLNIEPMQHKFFRNPNLLYQTDGFTIGFLMNIKYMFPEKPEDYSLNKVDSIEGEYISDEMDSAREYPNIIVIMNESYSDITKLYDIKTNIDSMPLFHNPPENVDVGLTEVSIFGGGTSKSEFEFLTGISNLFLPQNTSPYQQFCHSEFPSIVNSLSNLGYKTIAMHPFDPKGWDRDIAYPNLGFSEFLSEEDFPGVERIREFVSDRGMYSKIKSLIDEKDDDEPLFIFGVTMQNHAKYDTEYDNFTPEVVAVGDENNYELSMYLSLMRESDLALQDLIEYFKDKDEPIVILMFGDHFPQHAFITQERKDTGNRFQTPYLIWSNIELTGDTSEVTSLNFILTDLMNRVGMPLSGFQKFLLKVHEEFAIVSDITITDIDGIIRDADKYSSYEILNDYDTLSYNLVFDRKKIDRNWYILQEPS